MWRLVTALLLIPSLALAGPTSLDVSWDAPTTSDCTGVAPNCNTETPPVCTPCSPALDDLAGYRLYLSTPCPSQQFATVPSPTASPSSGTRVGVTINGLMPSTTYTARVTAVDFIGNESVCSAMATGTTGPPVPPSNVTNLQLSFRQEPPPNMAAVFDAATAPAGVNATSLTFSHTIGTGANRALAVTVATNASSGATGVTYNGVALTLEAAITITVNDTVEIWKTTAEPAEGAHDVVITVATTRNINGGAISAHGVDQADVSLANATAQGTDAAPTVNVTSVAGDLVISMAMTDANVTHAPGGGETERWDTTNPSGLRDSGTTESPAGTTTTMSRTLGSAIDWGIVAMSFRAASGAFALDAAPGAYSVTGSVAGAVSGRMVNAALGTYAITGAQAGVVAGRAINAQPGAYALTGVAASLIVDRMLSASPGAYVITGFDAELLFTTFGAFSLNAEPGAYAITGALAEILAGRVLNAAPGTYAITGVQAALLADRMLRADPGAYVISGADAALVFAGLGNFFLNAEPGSYVIVGADAIFIIGGEGQVSLVLAPSITNVLNFLGEAGGLASFTADARLPVSFNPKVIH